jgi:hypothetical protein
MRFAAVIAVLVLAALFVACTKSAVQTTSTTPNTAGDAATSLESEFDSFDDSTSSMADGFSDQDLAQVTSP